MTYYLFGEFLQEGQEFLLHLLIFLPVECVDIIDKDQRAGSPLRETGNSGDGCARSVK